MNKNPRKVRTRDLQVTSPTVFNPINRYDREQLNLKHLNRQLVTQYLKKVLGYINVRGLTEWKFIITNSYIKKRVSSFWGCENDDCWILMIDVWWKHAVVDRCLRKPKQNSVRFSLRKYEEANQTRSWIIHENMKRLMSWPTVSKLIRDWPWVSGDVK